DRLTMHIEFPEYRVNPNNPLLKQGIPHREKIIDCDVAVVGGGMAGICAAIAAARHGATTHLIQDRPVLGGNASSEIRVNIRGARCRREGKIIIEHETGIIEELLLANIFDNPQNSYTVWDHILYDFVTREENLTLHLNTQAIEAKVSDSIIEEAVCWQATTETILRFQAKHYIDCSGDGLLAASAGAPYRTGREAAAEFDESFAPSQADGWQMGASLLLKTRDMGRPMPYRPPSFTLKVDREALRKRKIKTLKEGYWWIELGSDEDIIAQQEANRHRLMGYLHGVWDYIKNSGDYPEAENLVLEWVGSVPGKRESRRFIGDHILSERDLTERRIFNDAVAYGGWPIDEHCPGGILSPDLPPTEFHHFFEYPYQIPFRSLYSCTIKNLLFAGRNISQTHIALATTRVMATGALMGQAVGTAAAFAAHHDLDPAEIAKHHIETLQEMLLRDDVYIPLRPARDPNDLAKMATLEASSTSCGRVSLLTDGVARDEDGVCHHWESECLPAEIKLTWPRPVEIDTVELKLDTDLHRELEKAMKMFPAGSQTIVPPPDRLVRHLQILIPDSSNAWQLLAEQDNITKRLIRFRFPKVSTNSLVIRILNTYG
ncbi:MAG: FAD-dependent oxidoreductase, partial [Lentisphaerae bacterium]